MQNPKKHPFWQLTLGMLMMILGLAACQTDTAPTNTSQSPTTAPQLAPTTPAQSNNGEAYPISGIPQHDPGYPIPVPEIIQNAQPEAPNPAVNLPAANPDTAVIGGVLIRELIGTGFLPLEANELVLAEILYDSNGAARYIRSNDDSIRAEMFPTGIFIFQNVPPGTYGLVADLAFTQFALNDDSGNPMLIEVSGGDVIDLGQVITNIP